MRPLQTLGDEGMNQPVKFHELAVLGRDGRLCEIYGQPREGFLMDVGGRDGIFVATMIDALQRQVLLRGCHGIKVLRGLPRYKLHFGYGMTFISGGNCCFPLIRYGEGGSGSIKLWCLRR